MFRSVLFFRETLYCHKFQVFRFEKYYMFPHAHPFVHVPFSCIYARDCINWGRPKPSCSTPTTIVDPLFSYYILPPTFLLSRTIHEYIRPSICYRSSMSVGPCCPHDLQCTGDDSPASPEYVCIQQENWILLLLLCEISRKWRSRLFRIHLTKS